MHTLQLQVDDSNAITFEEAKLKVQRAINNISDTSGLELDDAFDKVLHSQIIVEPEALQDNLNKANKFISQLKANIKTLNEMPERCRKSY